MSKKQIANLFWSIGAELFILILIFVFVDSLKSNHALKISVLFLNLLFVWLVNLATAQRGDRYIQQNHLELYKKYYNNDWIGRPQFIAAILLFRKESDEDDLVSLKKEAKIMLLFSLFVLILSLIIAIAV